MKKSTFCYTALRRNLIGTALLALILGAVLALFLYMLSVRPVLFEEYSLSGKPADIPAEQGYTVFGTDDVCHVALCGNPAIDGKVVKLFLTNPSDNGVCVRAEIHEAELTRDESGAITNAAPGKLLGRSGFIRPGEYVEQIFLKAKLKEDATYVMIKISTYEEATGASHGFFYVNTVFNQ